MANYVGHARSNYLRVRDEAAFLGWVETLPGVVARREDGDRERFVLLVEDGDDGGWPNWRYHEDVDGEEEIDLHAELSEHLAEGEVAVLEEVGAEKLRYLVGYAVAVNHKGETLSISIDEIYQKVHEAGWGDDVSTATY
ncbi:hypothetical protein BH24ACT20_BH24ACT20_00350 [soil metagenome]|jgi:hypothetical protein